MSDRVVYTRAWAWPGKAEELRQCSECGRRVDTIVLLGRRYFIPHLPPSDTVLLMCPAPWRLAPRDNETTNR